MAYGYQGGAYLRFLLLEATRVFVLLPGWDASTPQGFPLALNVPVSIYALGWRELLQV